MSDRQGGNYGLRRSAAPKKFDSDFEYYYTKSKNTTESTSGHELDVKPVVLSKSVSISDNTDIPTTPNKKKYEVHIIDDMELNVPIESPSKRARGRPKKGANTSEPPIIVPDEADLDVNYIHLKSKRDKRLMREERVEECETVESVIESLEQGLGQELMVEEVIPQGETHVIISADPEDEKCIQMDELRRVRDIMEVEQAVISLPQHNEKENNPDTDHTETIPEEAHEEILMLGMDSDGDCQMEELSDIRVEIGTDGVEVPNRKRNRKYRKIKATAETLRHLKEFGADDKIECNECHKLLKPSSFRQHLKTHSGIKPFGCEVCEARFTRKGDVERHIRIVHNKQKPFSCHRCPRSFGDKKNLRWHLMNHDKKLFYVCETCGFKFGKKEYYENHVRFIHPIPDDDQFVVEEEEEEIANSILSASMDVEAEGNSSADTLQMHSYTAASGFIIKKGGNLISVMDSAGNDANDDLEGAETLEITESQLQNLLQQNAMGKQIAILNPKRVKQTTKQPKMAFPIKSIPKSAKNSQVVTFKDLEQITNLSSVQLAKIHMSSKSADKNGIDAVVIQIDESGNIETSTLCQQQVTVEEEVIVENTEVDENMPVIVSSQSIDQEESETVATEAGPSQEQPKEVNIVVSKSSSQEGGEADANVQSLIDALLDAAKDSNQSSENT
jgi:hypothetical protein